MMNLFEIAEQLPNGFHDAYLMSVTQHSDGEGCSMKIDLLVGDPDGPAEQREALRSAQFEFRGAPGFRTDPPGLVIEPDQRVDRFDQLGDSLVARFFLSEQNAVLLIGAEQVVGPPPALAGHRAAHSSMKRTRGFTRGLGQLCR